LCSSAALAISGTSMLILLTSSPFFVRKSAVDLSIVARISFEMDSSSMSVFWVRSWSSPCSFDRVFSRADVSLWQVGLPLCEAP
jgi:hypothetical protein